MVHYFDKLNKTLQNESVVILEIYDDCGNVRKRIKSDNIGVIRYAINNIDKDESYKIINENLNATYLEKLSYTINQTLKQK